MGRLTKEQRALRDAFKGGAESEFCKAMRRVEKAAERCSEKMQRQVVAMRRLASKGDG